MITVTTNGGSTTLTLDRPAKANALTQDMLAALLAAVEAAQGARVLVITGAGKVFSAGADLEAVAAGLSHSPVWNRLSDAIAAHPGLTIAALNGTMAGGSFGMVLACDLRIAVPDAAFFYPVARLGYLPPASDPKRLAALVGAGAARRILLAGQRLDAVEALRIGLIDEICEREDMPSRIAALSEAALNADPAQFAKLKALIS